MISQQAINIVTEDTYYGTNMDVCTLEHFLTSDNLSLHGPSNYDQDIEHFCTLVVDPDNGNITTNYKTLTQYPVMKKTFGQRF